MAPAPRACRSRAAPGAAVQIDTADAAPVNELGVRSGLDRRFGQRRVGACADGMEGGAPPQGIDRQQGGRRTSPRIGREEARIDAFFLQHHAREPADAVIADRRRQAGFHAEPRGDEGGSAGRAGGNDLDRVDQNAGLALRNPVDRGRATMSTVVRPMASRPLFKPSTPLRRRRLEPSTPQPSLQGSGYRPESGRQDRGDRELQWLR